MIFQRDCFLTNFGYILAGLFYFLSQDGSISLLRQQCMVVSSI